MRILIPELAEDARPIAAALAAQGHQVVCAPLEVVNLVADTPINLANAQGFVVASPAAARALAERIGVRTFPAFADSAFTAEELKRAGFRHIETASDTVGLAQLVQSHLTPATGALMHPCAAGAPASAAPLLTNVGFAVRPLPLYTLARIERLPTDLRAQLKDGAFDCAVFATADAARSFVALLQHEGIAGAARKMCVVAATNVVAAPLRAETFDAIIVPTHGDVDGLSAGVTQATADHERHRRAAQEAEDDRRAAEAKAEAERVAAAKQAEEERAAAKAEAAERRAADKAAAKARAAEVRAAAKERARAEQAAREEATRRDAERSRPAAAEPATESSAVRGVGARRRPRAAIQSPRPVSLPVAETPLPVEPAVPPASSSATLAPPVSEPAIMEQSVTTSSSSDHAQEAGPAVIPEPVPDLARATVPEAAAADAAVALRGRVARQQAEDAADAAPRTPRWQGHGDVPGGEAAAGETSAPTEPADTAPRRRGRLVPALLLIAVVAAVGYVLVSRSPRTPAPIAALVTPANTPSGETGPPQAPPVATTPAMPAPTAAIAGDSQAQQIASLTARITTLEEALGNSARLQEVAKRIDALEGKSADASSVLALSDRVSALEKITRTAVVEQSARVAQMLAVAQWREAVASGRPYALELESVKALSARGGLALGLDDPRVTARAGSGIATFSDLRDRFDDTAAHVMRSGAMPQGIGGWIARSFDRVLSLVTIRRVDGLAAGTSPAAILARAGAQLRNNNLGACVTELDALTGPAAEAAKLWLDEARARVAAEAAVNDASIKTIAALATGGETPAKAAP